MQVKQNYSVCRLDSITAFGITGQTYSQVPQPLQSCRSILIPSPYTTIKAAEH
ncbi:MAG: hypothetical protein PHR66_04555 [Desulfuromonadaceae bacterium]|nr:hypothetical protein [Desulfuromonadaceae bacterium]